MTAVQTLRLFEILNTQFGQPEAARQAVEAFEAVISERVDERTTGFERSLNKDIESLRRETRTTFADVAQVAASRSAKIAESEVKRLQRVLMMLLVPVYVGMIVFLIKPFV